MNDTQYIVVAGMSAILAQDVGPGIQKLLLNDRWFSKLKQQTHPYRLLFNETLDRMLIDLESDKEAELFENIKKRDGRVVGFDASKITAAIVKAGKATEEFGDREAKKLTLKVLSLAHESHLGSVPEVEEIQDIVERVLLDSPFYKTAKAYILYREQHAQIRAMATKANVGLVESYLQKRDWKVNENSNMSYSLQGLNNYISSDITSEYRLNRIYPPEIKQAPKNGDCHLHHISLLAPYCDGRDLKDLLIIHIPTRVGFQTPFSSITLDFYVSNSEIKVSDYRWIIFLKREKG